MESYVYDFANRLVDANGIDYQWEANGNLLWDGQRAYSYDYANHMLPAGGDTYQWLGQWEFPRRRASL